jgi:hypothetical protein
MFSVGWIVAWDLLHERRKMKNKLFLVSLLSTALSAMTAGAVPVNITPGSDQLLDKTEYSAYTGSNGNSPANNLKLLWNIGSDLLPNSGPQSA